MNARRRFLDEVVEGNGLEIIREATYQSSDVRRYRRRKRARVRPPTHNFTNGKPTFQNLNLFSA